MLFVCLLPSAAVALGLGDIHLNSSLNAPLDADIDVVGATTEELADFKPTLASRDMFTRYGLDYPSFLSRVTLQLVRGSDGRNVIHLHSADPVAEPFATLLLEVNWARGRLVREYTVLLDPPVFAQPGAAAAVAAPTTGAARNGTVQRPASAAAPASSPAPASNPAPVASSNPAAATASAPNSAAGSAAPPPGGGAGGIYTVHPGDTLSGIAARNYSVPDRSARERALAGIYRANPSAFDGNMNALRSGSRLNLPTAADVAAISPGEASAEVRSQYAAWLARTHGATAAPASGAGQLRLVPPTETPATTPGSTQAASTSNSGTSSPASSASAAATQQRVQQLEQQLADQQRLLSARNAELAALQAQLARAASSGAAPASPALTPAPPPPAAAPAAPAASGSATPAATPPAPETAASPETAPAAAAPAPAAPPVSAAKSAPPASQGSLLDMVAEYWYVPAALVLLAVGALVALRVLRARQEEEFDRSLNRLGSMTIDRPMARAPVSDRDNTVPLRAAKPEQSFLVEESGSHEQPQFAPDSIDPSTTISRSVTVDDVTTDAPAAIEQGDPLAEADFHMAYGLYDQAADLVQIALQREPDRRDLRLKLLEVFFVWGNKDRFLQSARELSASRDQALPGEWEKVLIMGRQIAPEDPLFAGGEGLRGAASAGVDLNLEGGQNRIDFDLLGEPSVAPAAGDEGVDLDLSAALGDSETTGEAQKLSDTGVDFVLDDPQRGNDRLSSADVTGTLDLSADATGSTREMPGAGTATAETATIQLASADAPTVEQPQLTGGANETIRTKLDAPNRPGISADQTAELALDDLGLDLGALEATGEPPELGAEDAPTMLASVNDETRRLLAGAEAEGNDAEDHLPTASGTWLFTDTDFAGVVQNPEASADSPTEVVPRPPAESEGTSRMPVLEEAGLDLDLGDLSGGGARNGLDLDVGTANSDQDTGFHRTQRIEPGQGTTPDLEPATLSEVGTKLDLARAYMDMGDPDGARSILQEVLTEGSVAQKQEARRLMDTLPG
jgi:pilus assembly protein FimV